VTLVLRLAAGGIALLGALGFLVLFNRAFRTRAPVDWSIALTFLATAAYVPLVSALIAVNGRYRWPTEDLLIPVAASLLAPATRSMRVSEAIHSRRGPAFLPPESQADGTPGKRQ
jgi:multisubunit Na+/H+ antiporter MnhG subunit